MASEKRIAEFAEIKHGFAFEGQYFTDVEQEHLLLTPGNFHIEQKLYFGKNTKYYCGPIYDEYILQNGDLLVVMTDLTKEMAILGNAVILDCHKKVLHNQRIGLVKTGEGVDKNYLCYLLNSISVRNEVKASASGTTVRHTSPSKILNTKGWFPQLAEQKKIAQILSTWDQAIATTERLLDLARQQKKALMQQLLTGKKRFPGFEGVWQKIELGDVLDKISNGVTYDASNLEGLPVTRIETISTGKVNFDKVGWAPDEENTRRFKLENGDILYSHINSLEHIGRVAYFKDERPLFHGMNLLLLRANVKHDSLFLFYLLNSQIGKKFAKSHAKSAVNQASISTTDIKNFKVYLPEIKEQRTIASVLSASDQEIDTLQSQLDGLKQEKKALMQTLLTGKRRVKVALPECEG